MNTTGSLVVRPTIVGEPEQRFIPVIDPNISGTYESFLRRLCPTVVKVEERDDTGGFLKTRSQKVKELCDTIPNAFWTNQYGNLDAVEAHYELTAGEICADFYSLDYAFIGVSTAGTNRRSVSPVIRGGRIYRETQCRRHTPSLTPVIGVDGVGLLPRNSVVSKQDFYWRIAGASFIQKASRLALDFPSTSAKKESPAGSCCLSSQPLHAPPVRLNPSSGDSYENASSPQPPLS